MMTLQSPDFSRDMRPGEEPAVDALLRAAFVGGEDEVALVRKLRKSRAIAGETVLPMGDRIVGYYALSRLVSPKGWLVLAPVAIDPDMQGAGHGRRMIGMLTEWARLTRTPVVVLGQPAFYEKAGFSKEQASRLRSPYPPEYILLASCAGGQPAETLVYPTAFAAA
ncbi:GNAT family N-acetyltransferase [Loktanella agnita]|uniref:GNAT family N-acetyltransferase n=1 Tax=Loktanella agnita TaxID=287097 RepID=UPI003987F09C